MTRKRLLLSLGVVQLFLLLPIGLLDPMRFSNNRWFTQSLAIAVVLGCGFAQSSVAAAWMALGPLPLLVRGPLSLGWALLTSILLVVNIAVHGPDVGEGIFLGSSFVGVWLLVQAPLWIARGMFRLQLRSAREVNPTAAAGEHQFGIRQLLIVTAAVAISLGIGRLMILGPLPEHRLAGLGGGQFFTMTIIVGLFILCNSLVAFTVITGALLPRHWLFAVALGCCAASLVTLVEWSLFAQLAGGLDKGESLIVVAGMNGLQYCWLLFNLLVMRFAGYRLLAC